MFKNKQKFLLIFIVCLAAFLRLFRLGRADIMTDAAHYSFRAIGYLDWLFSDLQTTPLQWFGFRPWWSYLSFHDHPPLIFLIQNFFFKIFGITTTTSRLPFALFGIGSVILIYFLTKRLYGQTTGYLAALLLSICNYHVWISRLGYLESILIFFVCLAVYYFIRALEQERYWLYFGCSLGLAFLCKYTAFFLIPALFSYLLLQKREVFQSKKFWLGLLLCLIIFSPVIIYNLEMYLNRGHFDMQFAALFEQDMSDWPVIKRQVNLNFLDSFSSIWHTLQNSLAPVNFYLFLTALGLICFEAVRRKENYQRHWLMIWLLFFLTLFFILTATGTHYISVYTPLIVIFISYFLIRLIDFLNRKKISIVLLSLILIYIFLFTFNTNLLYQIKGKAGIWYSLIRSENWGFNQLEEWLNEKIKLKDKSLAKIKTIEDTYLVDAENVLRPHPEISDIFIYDDNLNWFARTWYFHRRMFYQKIVFISSQEFLSVAQEGQLPALTEYYQNFYFIRAVNEGLLDSVRHRTLFAQEMEKVLVEKFNLEPQLIKNPKGEIAFKIYQFE